MWFWQQKFYVGQAVKLKVFGQYNNCWGIIRGKHSISTDSWVVDVIYKDEISARYAFSEDEIEAA